MRSALAQVIAAVPGPVGKGADLHRALKIDRKLSWRVFKIANATDPITVGAHVPSTTKMTTFLKAAGKRGVPKGLIDSVSSIVGDFDQVVAAHAGDRTTFDSMVSSLSDDESAEQIHLVHRRLVFRGQRHIMGVHARTQVKFIAMQPSKEDPARLDCLKSEGLIDLRRLRGDAPLTVSYSGLYDDDGSPMAMRRMTLVPITDVHGLSLLPDFCSQPLPEFRSVRAGHGIVRGELAANEVGNRAAITCVTGHATPSVVPRYAQEGNRVSGVAVIVRIPCEKLVFDLALHKDVYGPIQPVVYVHAEHMGDMTWTDIIQNRFRLPFSPPANYLGRGPSVLHTVDVPRYAEMGSYLFDRVGWDGEQFDVYRCRLEYPIMPSAIELEFELPDAPASA